ncbi:DUF262 domain-containing protein [Roseburia inulinivorans]|uniref:DUF262 domain-containing protein n=1 Tax=Roseburia inulinivorans TaxID=360807 RepID=UPI00266B7A4A|nr:DUF262 domain-containing protein [Roseburia inulinivorans]
MSDGTEFKQVNFYELIKLIEEDRIVLPDFQRGFVWKDKNKQKALIASVLTKLPIGTILLLEIEKNTYGCKKIGFKNRKPDIPDDQNKVLALLDGQQRVTVLTSFFSNELYVIGDSSEFVSPSLKRRYFLRCPKIKDLLDKKDLFGARKLIAPEEIQKSQNQYPDYSTDEIISYIACIDNIKYKEIIYEDISNVNIDNLIEFCTSSSETNDGYLIPLYYLYGAANKSNMNHRKRLEKIIERIAEKYKNEIIDLLKTQGEIRDFIITECFEETEDGKAIAEDIKSALVTELQNEDSDIYIKLTELLQNRSTQWARDISEFLESCVLKLELYKIEVNQANILRAIDIYQNLNLGGKALDIFDLILARAAIQSDNENLLDVVKGCLIENHIQDYKAFVKDCAPKIQTEYNSYLDNQTEYSAAMQLGAWNQIENELAVSFCKALMSVTGTLYHFWNDESEQVIFADDRVKAFTSKVTKSEYLLKIEPEKIDPLIRLACKGLDRACIFLQLRCGIRSVTEIQYKLVFVILAVIFSKDDWFHNKKVCDYLEAWYWGSIFSGSFKIEQNAAFQDNLKNILQLLNEVEKESVAKPEYIINICNKTFCDDKFANEEILLVDNQFVEPEEILKKSICHFYLAKTYSDILKNNANDKYKQKQNSVFSECKNGETLQYHHIMPIGELGTIYKDIDKKLNESGRKDRSNKYNSPLNFMLISSLANRLILNSPLSYYIKFCDNTPLTEMGIQQGITDSNIKDTNKEIDKMLHKRYQKLCSDLRSLYAEKLGVSETELEDFFEKSRSKRTDLD